MARGGFAAQGAPRGRPARAGFLDREPPRRPDPTPPAAPPSFRNEAWKFAFIGSRDRTSGAVHLPPQRVSVKGGAVDDMEMVPIAATPALEFDKIVIGASIRYGKHQPSFARPPFTTTFFRNFWRSTFIQFNILKSIISKFFN